VIVPPALAIAPDARGSECRHRSLQADPCFVISAAVTLDRKHIAGRIGVHGAAVADPRFGSTAELRPDDSGSLDGALIRQGVRVAVGADMTAGKGQGASPRESHVVSKC